MRRASSYVKNALKQPTTRKKGSALIKGRWRDVFNVEYYADCYDEGRVIGNAIASQIEFDVDYTEKFDNFIYCDLTWTGQTYEVVNFGTFYVIDEKNEDDFTKHIIAFDSLIKFNSPYEETGTYPKTLFQELQDLCTQAGVILGNESIPNGNFIVENNQFVNGENKKTVLKQICGISGTYATMKRNGNDDVLYLQLKNVTDEVINKSQHTPIDWKRKSYGINQVIIGDSQVEGEYVIKQDDADIALNGVHKLEILDNLFAYTQEKRSALIDALYDQVHGFGYIPFETQGEWLSYMEVGDTVTIDDVETIILRINAKTPKSVESIMSAPAIIDNAIEYVDNTDDINSKVKRTELSVDKANQRIDGVIQSVTDQGETIVQLQADLSGFETTVSQTYETKSDATSKLGEAKTYAEGQASTAENNAKTYADGVGTSAVSTAKNYTDGQLVNYSTTIQMNSAINQKADEINVNVNKNTENINGIIHTIDETEIGNPLYIENAQNSKPIEMELYGNTKQDSYSGKNLLNIYAPLQTNNANTFEILANDWMHYVNTSGASEKVGFADFNVEPNTKYSILVETKDVTGKPFVIWNERSNSASISTIYPNTSRVITTSANTTIVRLSITTSNQTTTGNYKIRIMISKSETIDNNYEQYVGGIPSPNPDYPQNVETVTGRQNVSVVGKNIFIPTLINNGTYITLSRCTATLSDGEYTLTATGADMYFGEVANPNVVYSNDKGVLYEFTSNVYQVTITNTLFTKNYVTYYDENKVSLGYINKGANKFDIQKTDKTGAKYFSLRLGYGSAVSGTSYKFKVQLERGTKKTDYEKYNGNLYEINLPIELCKISTYRDYIKKSTGKNLFDKDNANIIDKCYINTNTDTLTSDNNCKTLYIPCEPNTTYTVSKILSSRFVIGTTTDIPAVGQTLINKVAGNSQISLTITTQSNSKYLVLFYYRSASDTTITEQEILNSIQIEQNSTATDSEPYGVGKWYVCKKIGKLTLDGTESDWAKSGTGYVIPKSSINNQYLPSATTNYYCNYFTVASSGSTVGTTRVESTNLIFYYDNSGNYLNDFKTWLGTHNTIVYYILQAPTYTEITDTELINQLNEIELLTGINNITITSDDLPADMYLKYYLHTPLSETYINQVQLQSSLDITSESITASVSKETDDKLSSYATKTEVTQTSEGITARIDKISTNIDENTGDVERIKTSTGYTFDENGMSISKDDSEFSALHTNEGTFYKNNGSIVSQITKDNIINKDMVLYGKYYYGVDSDLDVENFTKDDAMFIAEMYEDGNGEVGFGHFLNNLGGN